MQVAPINILADKVQRRISVKQRASAAQHLPQLGPKKAYKPSTYKCRFSSIPKTSFKRLPLVRPLEMQNVKW